MREAENRSHNWKAVPPKDTCSGTWKCTQRGRDKGGHKVVKCRLGSDHMTLEDMRHILVSAQSCSFTLSQGRCWVVRGSGSNPHTNLQGKYNNPHFTGKKTNVKSCALNRASCSVSAEWRLDPSSLQSLCHITCHNKEMDPPSYMATHHVFRHKLLVELQSFIIFRKNHPSNFIILYILSKVLATDFPLLCTFALITVETTCSWTDPTGSPDCKQGLAHEPWLSQVSICTYQDCEEL